MFFPFQKPILVFAFQNSGSNAGELCFESFQNGCPGGFKLAALTAPMQVSCNHLINVIARQSVVDNSQRGFALFHTGRGDVDDILLEVVFFLRDGLGFDERRGADELDPGEIERRPRPWPSPPP